MRRLLILVFASFCWLSASADQTSQGILQRVAQYIKALGSYDAGFVVRANDYTTTGSYCVEGDAYHISLDRAEVFSDGETRYEVDHDRAEVNIDVMDLESYNVMDNPTRCFDFVDKGYTSKIHTRQAGEVTLLLHSTDEDIEGDIYLTVDERTFRPKMIAYELYDDRIEVTITSIEQRKRPIGRFDESKYKGYEIVDFR